jgi:SpoU rRNA methylase family enzyme
LKNDASNVFVILHNVHAVSKVIETAQVIYGLGFANYVVTKAEGSAAQTGVPDANRLAMKMKSNFMVLPDLNDALELLDVSRPFLLTSPMLSDKRVETDDMIDHLKSIGRLAIVVSGSNSSFSRKEMDLGECVSLDAKVDIGPAGTAAVVLYALKAALS